MNKKSTAMLLAGIITALCLTASCSIRENPSTETSSAYTIQTLDGQLGAPKEEIVQAYGLTDAEAAEVSESGNQEEWLIKEPVYLFDTAVAPCFIFYNDIMAGYQFRTDNPPAEDMLEAFVFAAFEELKRIHGEPTTYPGMPNTLAQLKADLKQGTIQATNSYREEWDIPLDNPAIQTLASDSNRAYERAGMELNVNIVENGPATITIRYFLIGFHQ